MAPQKSAKETLGAVTSLIIHIELPALGQRAQLQFALEPTKSERVFGGLYDFVSGISREWDDELLEFDVEGTEFKLETLRANVAADLDSWNKKVKDAEDWKRKVDNAATTMNKMRDAYFKELMHLREQIYRQDKAQKEGTDFHPVYALHFDPTEYTMDDEVARMVAAKTALLEQEFQTKMDELEVKTGARVQSLTDQLVAARMSASRKDKLLDKLKEKNGWDNQKLLALLETQQVNQEQVVTKIEARAEQAEQLATAAFKELADKQINCEAVYSETQALLGFLERKYGSLSEATAVLSQKYDLGQHLGLTEFQELTDHIGYVTDAKRAFVRLSGGNTSMALADLMERLTMPPPEKQQAPDEKKVARRKSASDAVELTGDWLQDGSGAARRLNIDQAVAAIAEKSRARKNGTGSGSDSGSDSSGLGGESSGGVVGPSRALPGTKARTLKVSCEVMTDVTFDSGAQAAFGDRDPLRKKAVSVGCDARSFDSSFQKRSFKTRGCQSNVDRRLLDKAAKFFESETEAIWSVLAGLDPVEKMPDLEEQAARAQKTAASAKKHRRSSVEAAKTKKKKKTLGKTRKAGAGAGQIADSSSSCDSEEDGDSQGSDDAEDEEEEEEEEEDEKNDVEDQEPEADASPDGEKAETGAAGGPRRSRRHPGDSTAGAKGGTEIANESLNDERDASLLATAELSRQAGDEQSACSHASRPLHARGRRPSIVTLGGEELLPQDGLLPPPGEAPNLLKKALGRAMTRHMPGIGGAEKGATGQSPRTSFAQTGGTGETGDLVRTRVPLCDAGVQTDMTPEQVLAAFDWQPPQDLSDEERVKSLLDLTQEIESRLPSIWEQAKKLAGQQPSSMADKLVRRLARWPIGEIAKDTCEIAKSTCEIARFKISGLRKRGTADLCVDDPQSIRHTFGGAMGQRTTFDGRQEPTLMAVTLGEGLPDKAQSSGLNNFRFKAAQKQLSQPGREFVDDHVVGIDTALSRPTLRTGGNSPTPRTGSTRPLDSAAPETDKEDEEFVKVSRSQATTARKKSGMDRVQALVEEAKRKSASGAEAGSGSACVSSTNFASEPTQGGDQQGNLALAPGWSGLVPAVSFSSSRKLESGADGQGGGPEVPGADQATSVEPFSPKSFVRPAMRKMGTGESLASAPDRQPQRMGKININIVVADSVGNGERHSEPVFHAPGSIPMISPQSHKPRILVDNAPMRSDAANLSPHERSSLLGDVATSPRRLRGLPADARSENVGAFRQRGGAAVATPAAAVGAQQRGVEATLSSEPDTFQRRSAPSGGGGGDLLGTASPEGEGFLPLVLPKLPRNQAGDAAEQASSSTSHSRDRLDSTGAQATRASTAREPRGSQRPAFNRGTTEPMLSQEMMSDVQSALRVGKQPSTASKPSQSLQVPSKELHCATPNALRVDKQPAVKGPMLPSTLPDVRSNSKAPQASLSPDGASQNGARLGTRGMSRAATKTGEDMERVTFSGILPSSRESNTSDRELSPKKGSRDGADLGRASFNVFGVGSSRAKR